MPHARSSTREPATSSSECDGGAAPRDVHAERQHPVEQVVTGRDPVEHLFDDARFLLADREPVLGLDHVAAPDCDGARLELACRLRARGRELVVFADRLEVLLRDGEQHAPEVVLDERGHRRQQRRNASTSRWAFSSSEIVDARSGVRT